jgi:uroporphyrinogen-III synthase
MPEGLGGLTVVSFESRRSAEMAQLIRNYGGEPIQAPSLREVRLSDQHEALAFGDALMAGGCEVLILLTGVGARILIGALETRWPRERVLAALGRITLVCRGPKPVGVLKEAGLAPALAVPEPNTWRDVLTALDRSVPVAGKAVAVQEYGAPNGELVAGLEQRGARVTTVSVYGWALPEDTGPLRAAIERLAAGRGEVALFSSATQVDHLFRVAGEMGQAEALRSALRRRTVVASIGPVTTAALRAHGIEPDLHPERAKMGHLVACVARDAGGALDRKRRG